MNQYVSLRTGEIVDGFINVIITVFTELFRYRIINLRWEKFTPHYFD